MQKDLNAKISQAVRWSSVCEVCSKLIVPVTNAILARLLMPEVFGVVATLTLIVSLAEVFTDAGFQKYLVQHVFENETELNNSTNAAFWANLMLSLVLWTVISVFADPIAAAVGSPGYGSAVVAMGAQIPLLAFSGIQTARFRREFAFKSLFGVRMAVSMIPLVITVPAAWFLRNHWALVLGTLARDAVNAVVLTAHSPWKPELKMDFGALKKMLPFTFWTLLENITIWLTANAGVLILSGILSSHYLGLYKTTIATGNSYLGIITASATPVLFSALSRCQNDREQFRKVFSRFQGMTALLVLPLSFGAYVFRDFVTQLLLGSQWQETASFLGLWFLVSGLKIVYHNYNSEAFRSMGRPALSILVQMLYLAVLIPVLLWSAGQPYGQMTTIQALTVLVIIVISSVTLQKTIGIRFAESLANTWAPLVAAVVMAVFGAVLKSVFIGFWMQVVSVLLCAWVYGSVLLCLPAGRKLLSQVPILNKWLR